MTTPVIDFKKALNHVYDMGLLPSDFTKIIIKEKKILFKGIVTSLFANNHLPHLQVLPNNDLLYHRAIDGVYLNIVLTIKQEEQL